ncbi:hypothetical protein [Pseudomonas umsongensis]
MIHKEVLEVLSETNVLARKFYRLTVKPLEITGEVAEYEADMSCWFWIKLIEFNHRTSLSKSSSAL